MHDPLGKLFWDKIEYELEMKKWREEHGIQTEDSSTSSSTDTDSCVSVPLSALRKVNLDVEEGYVTERRAGKYMERRIVTVQQTQGSLIRKMRHEDLFGEGVVKPYCLKSDLFNAFEVCDDDGVIKPDYIQVDEEKGLYCHYTSVKFMKTNTSRFANIRQVKKTCDNFKWLVRANEDRVRLFVTLTYAQNMRDTKKLYNDYREFWQRLQRAYGQITGYLVAFEPQKRGAWHAHVLLLSDSPLLYISNKHMRALWGHGFTKTQRPKGINDVASYLTSYLTNMKDGAGTKKGARLAMYPAGFRFCRSSKRVRHTSVRKWFGSWNRLHRINDWKLLYDYQNVRRLSRDIYNVSKILCLEDSSGVFFETPQ